MCRQSGQTEQEQRMQHYKRWDRGLPGGTPATTTIIICTTLCAHRYISRVRSSQVLIFMYWAKVSSWYYDGRSCPICTRCFHRCSARIPTITSFVEVNQTRSLKRQRHRGCCCAFIRGALRLVGVESESHDCKARQPRSEVDWTRGRTENSAERVAAAGLKAPVARWAKGDLVRSPACQCDAESRTR